MTESRPDGAIYAKGTLEFVTVAAEYCAQMEQCAGKTRSDFADTMLKLLPLLYMKARMLPSMDEDASFLPDGQVSEDDYNYVRMNVYRIFGKDDQYEELTANEDMNTEESQWRSLSEDLADIYQPLRNFVFVYQQRLETCMPPALYEVEESFRQYWGTDLLCALKRLHTMDNATQTTDDEDDTE